MKKMKFIWFIVYFGLILIKATEYNQFSKMVVGDYICYDDSEISMVRITLLKKEKKFEFTELTIDFEENVEEEYTCTFTMSNPVISKARNLEFSLREDENFYIYGKGHKLTQVLYKLPEQCNFEQVKQALHKLLKSEKYAPPLDLSNNQFQASFFDYNRQFLTRNISNIFQQKQVMEMMKKKIIDDRITKKLMDDEAKNNSPSFSSPAPKHKFSNLFLWGCGFLILGAICLLVAHPYLTQLINETTNEQKTTDVSLSNETYISEDV